MITNELEAHLHLIQKAIKEFSNEPANLPQEQFEAAIDAIKHLLDYTKTLYPTGNEGRFISISPRFSSF
jgi:hypothetical protein